MYLIHTFILSVFYLFLLIAAFQGLIGAFYKNFKFIRSRYSGPMFKYYKGNNAVIWGVLFFIAFGIMPLAIFNIYWNNTNYSVFTLCYFILLTIAAFVLALLSRKYGMWKVK
jgi:hypothetical protein